MTRDEMIETLERLEQFCTYQINDAATRLDKRGNSEAVKACLDVHGVLAALRAPAVTGEAQDVLPMSERTWTSKELVEAIQHGIATARMQWTCPHCERQSAPPAAGAPPALVALVQEFQAAEKAWGDAPVPETGWSEDRRERIDRVMRAEKALLAWSPAPAPVTPPEPRKDCPHCRGYGFCGPSPDSPECLCRFDSPAPVAPPADWRNRAALLDSPLYTPAPHPPEEDTPAPPAVAGGDAPEIQVGDYIGWRHRQTGEVFDAPGLRHRVAVPEAWQQGGDEVCELLSVERDDVVIWRRRQEGQ